MGAIGIVPFQQVTAQGQLLLNVATLGTNLSSSSNVVGQYLKPGILNAMVINGTGTFILYDAQIVNSTVSSYSSSAGFASYSLFSGSVAANSANGGNMLVSYSQVIQTVTSASVPMNAVISPTIIDLNIPFKNGIVMVGSNVNVNLLVS